MKQNIKREYIISADEAKTALWMYLKSIDRPVPQGPATLDVAWNGPGDVFVSYTEVLVFDKADK